MSVQLLAIKFNHDPASANNNALNIRKNASQFVNVPEWQRGLSVNPEDSPVAYAIKETQGNTITIQAKFRRTDPTIQSVEVRAVDPTVNPPKPSGCLNIILWIIRSIIRALFGNVLGEAKARQVTFQASGDDSNYETFELEHVRLWDTGIGIRTTKWQWQYRIQSTDPWTNIDISQHKIYSVLEIPKEPWQQSPYNSSNTQLPWTDALDYVCQWAFLTNQRDDVAARVTKAIYDLGPSVIEYDCPGGGGPAYSTNWPQQTFDCTAFLERLGGGNGNGEYVNCMDCGTIVTSFSNLLGCELWSSRMASSFELNEILAIGSSIWQTACGWSSFNYHEVAWKGACDIDDEVFDACLQVDGDSDPTTAPHTALLPTNMRFGNTGDGDYRDKLAADTPSGRPNCNPQPGTRKRRSII